MNIRSRSTPKQPSPSRRSMLKLAGAAALAAPYLWIPKSHAAGKVIIRSPGGVYDDLRREIVYEPFRKLTGIEVVPVAMTAGKLYTMVRSGHIELDIADITTGTLTPFQRAGALVPIPYDKFQYADPADIDPNYKLEYMVGNFIYGIVMGYNASALQNVPENWAEFWDYKKFPAPRMLADIAAGYPDLEFALLADGVPLDKLYPLDIDRAFESLSRIRPSIRKFWDTGALSSQMLSDKEATLGSIWSTRLLAAADGGAPLAINWHQHGVHVQAYSIFKNAPNMENAVKLVDYCLSDDVQKAFAKRYPCGPVTKKAYETLPAELRARVPGGEMTAKNGFILDPEWWADNRQTVSDKWSKWVLNR